MPFRLVVCVSWFFFFRFLLCDCCFFSISLSVSILQEQTNGEVERATATPSHEDDVAVKSVQEMGYSKTVIETAVETLKKQGKTDD